MAVDALTVTMRYELVRPLGEGAFGAVFEARDRLTHEPLAIKELVRANSQALARFKQEFRALSDLHHPNLVELRELFEHEGRWFIAMELVEGDDFLSVLRGTADNWQGSEHGFDEPRLRAALEGINAGLFALHQHGILHRDLKPSNIMVTEEGRAVLLDFGLVTASDQAAQSTGALAVGTAAYMAPEQAAGRKVGPEADWYALGVCLYQALTGKLPFEGTTSLQLMLAKQGKRPLAPSSHVRGLPSDLERLCLALLEPDPGERLAAARQLASTGASSLSISPENSSPIPVSNAHFAGREDQLLHLDQAFERSQQGELTIVLVEGESGVGKSALVAEFLSQRRASHPDAVVLKGRCYENERVPFKAFDGCMDELGKVLKRLPRDRCAALLPRRAGLLAQLFPVLREVDSLRKAPLNDASAEPTARRLEAFAAMAGLFCNLTKQHALIVVVDDVQWADGESFRMLRALVEDRERPPLLLLCTVRPRHELEAEVAESLEQVRGWHRTSVLPLQGLPLRQARELAAQLLAGDAPIAWLQNIAEESKGHPLFISELVQYARSHDLGAAGSLTLEAALLSRIARLDADSKRLLEIVALAGRPYGSHIFARALGWEKGLGDASKKLLSEKLVLLRKDLQLVCFHDRIRHTVVSQLAQVRVRSLHRQLAEVLDQLDTPDLAERAQHWDGAGDVERAIVAYERAVKAAFESLSFARAEQFCARALVLMGDTRDARWLRLLVQRGDALARSGRCAEAARAYEVAADVAEGEARVRLRIRGAQQLLQSAQVEAGMRAARAVLSELGVPLPEGTAAAIARLLWDRAVLSARGLEVKGNATQKVTAAERLVLDALSELSFPVSWLELLPGASINTRHLRRTLSAGETGDMVRALCNEATFRAIEQPERTPRYAPLFARSRALLGDQCAPALEAYHLMAEGIAASFRYDVKQATEQLTQAQILFQTGSAGEPWLLTNVRLTLARMWYEQGEHALLARESEVWLSEARERQDQFALAALTGLGCGGVRLLCRDQPDLARQQLRDALAPWPREPFSLAHVGETLGIAGVELYCGGPGAFRWFEQERARHERAFVMKTHVGRLGVALHRALAALAAWSAVDKAQRAPLLRDVGKQARELSRLGGAYAKPVAAFVDAQARVLHGDREGALAEARAARAGLETGGFFYQHAAAYLEGALEGGDAGHGKRALALAFFEGQGWQNPVRALGMCLPILPVLEQPARSTATAPRELVQGRYELLRPLGDGSSGAVVEARDRTTGQRLALKELVRVAPASLARFKQEFRALQDLHHPNLVRLDALFEDAGRWFIAMELVEGTDWLSWVRGLEGYDDGRLRSTLVGLSQGLLALHDAGFLHCDVSPLNLRVTPEGRAVILDFGLVTSLADAVSGHAVAAGTPAYMAPEQMRGGTLSPAADAYSLGVCLYQALTGKLPFDAALPIDILRIKQAARPRPPSVINGKVAPALEGLCMQLLDPEPSARLSFSTLLDSLDTRASFVGEVHGLSHLPGGHAVFAGREDELSVLLRVLGRASAQRCSLLLVQGESGLGKTALIAEAQRLHRERAPDVLVLESRCYENEQIAYKAFDGAMDELGKVLRRLDPVTCDALLPPCAAALGQLFAGLGTVPSIAQAPKRALSADPTARRLEAFAALCELLGNLCATHPVVLTIDDLQWADAESFRLLRAIVDSAERLPLTLLCSVRPTHELEPSVVEQLDTVFKWPCTEVLQLKGLSSPAALDLAAQLLGPQATRSQLEAIVRECNGHPLFLGELATYAADRDVGASGSSISLDSALVARVHRLGPEARRTLELVALAGRPYGVHVFARALSRETGLGESATLLLAQKLLRAGRDHSLTCVQERIRRVVVEDLGAAGVRERSAALARALEVEREVDPAELARLWDAAGEVARAVDSYEAAGDRALEGLAFGRAEERYGRAIELSGAGHAARVRRLRVQRGHALARGGRSAEAAQVYEAAADGAEGEERTRLRIRFAQQLLHSAQFDAGMRAVRDLLAELGMPMPTTTAASLRQIAWDRTWLTLRGLGGQTRPAGEVPGDERLKLDALAEVAFPVAWVELLPGATLNGRHLRRALAAGDAGHVVRALCNEATYRALQNPTRTQDYEPLFERGRALLPQGRTPELEAFQSLTEGVAALFRWDLGQAHARLLAAEQELKTRCAGEAWLLTNARLSLGQVWFDQGEHARLEREGDAWLAEARERQDSFALAGLSALGCGFLRWLMRDEADAAEDELRRAMAPWQSGPFTLAHTGEFRSLFWSGLYRGGNGVARWLDENAERLDHAFVMKTAVARQWLFTGRALGALAALPDAPSTQRVATLRSVRDNARRLQRLTSPFATPMSELLLAQLDALSGDAAAALAHARAARAGFEQIGHFLRHQASYLEGVLEAGDAGRERCAAALTIFREQGWLRPERAIAMGLPVLDSLSAARGLL